MRCLLNNKWGHTLDGYGCQFDPLGLRTNIVRNLGLTSSSVTAGFDNIGQGCCISSVTHNIQFASGHGDDQPDYDDFKLAIFGFTVKNSARPMDLFRLIQHAVCLIKQIASYENCIFGFLVSLALFGCSKAPTDSPPNDGLPHNITTNGLPFVVTVVETPESKEWGNTMKLARTYFERKEYDKLEDLASEGRSVEASWPDGTWKVVPVYVGLEVAANAPDGVWIARQNAIKEWMQARPASITAPVALALNLTEFAWKARGSGYADTVTEAAGKLFDERLGHAANVLREAETLKGKCPVYWTTLMKIALGLQVSKMQFDHIFKQAIQAWPDYISAHK